jgi:predicted nucleic acid-binding Zn ribbon protein
MDAHGTARFSNAQATLTMPTYVYETIPADGQPPRRFEARESMHAPALTRDPATGEPVRRVISGGYGFYGAAAERPAPAAPCGSQCACFGQN